MTKDQLLELAHSAYKDGWGETAEEGDFSTETLRIIDRLADEPTKVVTQFDVLAGRAKPREMNYMMRNERASVEPKAEPGP